MNRGVVDIIVQTKKLLPCKLTKLIFKLNSEPIQDDQSVYALAAIKILQVVKEEAKKTFLL